MEVNDGLEKYSSLALSGLNIKRWILLLFVGVVFAGLGVAYILLELYRSMSFPPLVQYVTLQFLDQRLRGLLFFGLGVILAIVALARSASRWRTCCCPMASRV